MKRFPPWIIFVAVFALLVAVKMIFFPKKTETKGPSAKQGPVVTPVNYYVVKTEEAENTIETPGTIGTFNSVNLLPEVAGKVVAIYFKEGESVKKGTLLVKLNDADLQAQLIKSKESSRLSQQKLDRLKRLLEVKGVSQEEYDMQANEVETLRSDMAFIQAQIAKTTIVAPFDGVIGLKNVSEGAYVSANTPIVSLVQMKPLYVEFAVPEKYAAMLHTGDDVTFAQTSRPDVKGNAKVYAVEPAIDPMTKTLKARARYDGDQGFYPGSFVNVVVNLGAIKDAIFVPTQCIIPMLKGEKVMVARADTIVEIPVKTGIRNDVNIQVIEGLHAGDTVITTGLLSIKKGSHVRLISEGKPDSLQRSKSSAH